MMLTGLAEVLRDAGLDVVEEPGWKTRGHGGMRDVLGVTCHHTANGGAPGLEPSRGVVRDGRPGLDGPLSHLLLRKDGVFRVIAAGLCWHAGVSRSQLMGNAHRIGIEAEAKGVPGTVGDWPWVQMDAYARGCKALAVHYGFGVSNVLGHKETCSPAGRKSDPDFDMDVFRARVRGVDLNADQSPPKPAPPKQEAEMAQIEQSDVDRIAARVWTTKPATVGQETGGSLHEIDLRTGETNLRDRARDGARAALTAALADPADPLSVILKRIEDKIDALAEPAPEA